MKAVNVTAAVSLKEDEMEVRRRGFYFQGTSSELLIFGFNDAAAVEQLL